MSKEIVLIQDVDWHRFQMIVGSYTRYGYKFHKGIYKFNGKFTAILSGSKME